MLVEGMASIDVDWFRLTGRAATCVLALLGATAATAEQSAAAGRHASMVIDANSGAVLHAQAADEVRYPASLTKMMTLYIAFELLEQGRMSFSSWIKISDEAAGTPPSKLGLLAGSEIAVADAIKAIVTKSANDIAVALAEHIGGSEAKFAVLMNRKARELGMTATTFKNAHGLPDSGQVTTARDMLTLAMRLNDDFPKYYAVFGLRAFSYHGKTYRNHNTMLETYPGMDGLKTGYTTSSGFNLVASVRRNGKHVVAAVFGGSSASARNAHMRTILDRALTRASTEKSPARLTASGGARRARASRNAEAAGPREAAPSLIEPVRPAVRPRVVVAEAPSQPSAPRLPGRVTEALRNIETAPDAPDEPRTADSAAAEVRSNDTAPVPAHVTKSITPPIEIYKVRPVMVTPRVRTPVEAPSDATVSDPPQASRRAAPGPGTGLSPEPVALPRPIPAAPKIAAPVAPMPTPVRPSALDQPGPLAVSSRPAPAPAPVITSGPGMAPSSLQAQADRLRRGAEPLAAAETPRPIAIARTGTSTQPIFRLQGPGASSPPPAGTVSIQVGAYVTAVEAKRQLESVRARYRSLPAQAAPSAEPVQTGGRTLYRARFVGLDSASATAACTELRRLQVDCHVAR